jgi:CheY-like chemotaxis protein
MCSVLEMGLGRRGFDVETCTSAQQAIERLGAHEYAVLLTDLQMPGVGAIAFSDSTARPSSASSRCGKARPSNVHGFG